MSAMTTAWQNRIVGYGVEAPDQLAANPRNWRVHPKHQQVALAGSLNELGWIQNVIVNQRTGFVVDGHARAALALREQERTDQPVPVPVTYIDLSEDEEALAMATLDPIAAMAGADKDKLEELLAEIGTGPASLDPLLAELAKDHGIERGGSVGLTDPDEVPEAPEEPVTQPGDLWLLGEHRLLCGDATKAEDVARLLDGAKPACLCTDPPYGIRAITGGKGQWGGVAERYHPIIGDESSDVAKRAIAASSVLGIAAHVWWGANHYASALPDSSGWLVWYKRLGSDRNDFADCELAWTNRPTRARLFHHVWNGFLRDSEKGEERSHPTQKPIALIEWCLTEVDPSGDSVLDPFLGSGTTLIAAEQLGRRCYGMEIDPRYCDVIVARWEQFTGQTAERQRLEDAA